MADSPSQDPSLPSSPSATGGPGSTHASADASPGTGPPATPTDVTAATLASTGGSGISGLHDTELPERYGGQRPDTPLPDLPAGPLPAKGDKIGRYTIESHLGEGGMGVVFLAHDPELDRRVAIKSLRSDAWATGDSVLNTKMRQRLRREAQALAQLEHPNVVAVYDTGIHDGHLFVAMAYVEGQDLRAWFKADRDRPLDTILTVFEDAGRGLAAAHDAELIHRDFKPDNVLIDREGRAQVADFGLARGLSEGPEFEDIQDGALPSLVATLTRTGALMGTPPYMAPELFRGERGDASTDQFAYCVTLFEAVYGVRPFQGRNLDAISKAVLSGSMVEPDPGDRRTWRVPLALHRLIVRGLADKPEQRFPNMDALLVALGEVRQELRAQPERRRQRRKRRRRLFAASFVLAAASLALPPVRAELTKVPQVDALAKELGLRLDPAPAPVFALLSKSLAQAAPPSTADARSAAPSADDPWASLESGDLSWARDPELIAEAQRAHPDDPGKTDELRLIQALALLEFGDQAALPALLDAAPALAERPEAQIAQIRIQDPVEAKAGLDRLAEIRGAVPEGEALPWRLELAESELLLARADALESRSPGQSARDRSAARAKLEALQDAPMPARAHQLLAALDRREGDLSGTHEHLDAARQAATTDLDPRYARLHADFLADHGCRARATEALLELAKADGLPIPAAGGQASAPAGPRLLDAAGYRRLVELELLRLEDARFWGLPPEADPAWSRWLERAALDDAQLRDGLVIRHLLSSQGAAAQDELDALGDGLMQTDNPMSVSAESLALLARIDHAAQRKERAYARIREAERRAKSPIERARILTMLGRMQTTDGEVEPAAESFVEAWRLGQLSDAPDRGWLMELGELTIRYLRSQDKDVQAQQIATTLTRLMPEHATTWKLFADGLREDPARAKRAQARAQAASWCE